MSATIHRSVSGASLADCEAQLEPGETIVHTVGSRVTGSVVCQVAASPEASAVAEKVSEIVRPWNTSCQFTTEGAGTEMTTTTDAYGREFTLPGPFATITAIKEANKAAGRHFFDADSMGFFRSKIARGILVAGRLFITSEQFVPSDGVPEPRRYTVRVAHDNGSVTTVGEFQAYATLAEARHAAKDLAS